LKDRKTVRKAVMPVAGLGTRVLPVAKSIPKNMLNVVDRPILAYVVKEARAAGIEHIVFVTGRGQETVEHYFDRQPEIEDALIAKGKDLLVDELMDELLEPGQMSFVRQSSPLGLGHAIWCARDIIGDEPFAVLLPDMLMDAEPGALSQAIAAYNEVGGNIVLVEQAPDDQTHKYGIVSLAAGRDGLSKMTGMVEKPDPGTAPSNLAISGRYILQPEIFEALSSHQKGAGGEIQLTDAMVRMMKNQAFHALEFKGKTYDCGDKVGLLRANVAFALKRADLADAAREAILRELGG
jgi:UTP--glucose-1-phosphate uridylyltransferase